MRLPALFWRTAVLVTGILLAGCAAPGDPAQRSQDIVREARASLAHFAATPVLRPAVDSLPGAAAVVIFPRLTSAALIVGGAQADGLLFVRDLDTGHWIGPVFYTLVQGSVGLQAGVTRAEVLMIVNSQGALASLFKGRMRLGIDASVAVARGGGANSAITADIDSWALSQGLYAGIALNGSALRLRPDLNAAWYGQAVTPDDIVVQRKVHSPDSGRLATAIEALAR